MGQPNEPVRLTYKGVTHTRAEWADITGIPVHVQRYRQQHGWPVERILTEPPKHKQAPGSSGCQAKSIKDCFKCPFADCIRRATEKLEGEAWIFKETNKEAKKQWSGRG